MSLCVGGESRRILTTGQAPGDARVQLKREGTSTVTHFQEKQWLQECTREPHSNVSSGTEKMHFDSLISEPGCQGPFWLLLHCAQLDSRRGESYLFLIKYSYLLLSAQSVFIKCQIQATQGGGPPRASHRVFPARPFKSTRMSDNFFFFSICCSRFPTLLLLAIKMHGPVASRSPDCLRHSGIREHTKFLPSSRQL